MSFYNQTNNTNFKVEVQKNQATNFTLNVQRTTIPGMRITVVETPSMHGLHRQHIQGSATEFEPLTLTFLVDEELQSYLDVYEWMLKINNYQTGSSQPIHDTSQNLTVHILDNNKQALPVTFEFVDSFPYELGDLEYSYTEEGVLYMTCTATFHYKRMNVYKKGVKIT